MPSFNEQVLIRDPVTGDFGPYATKFISSDRFYSSWYPGEFDPHIDPTGLSSDYGLFSKLLYPFEFETKFDAQYPMWARQLWWLPYVLSAVYILLVLFIGPKLMKGREPIQCQRPLKYWNLFLAVFSFIGMIRTVPHLFVLLFQVGWSGVVCFPMYSTYGHGACGLWAFLFTVSKIFEFIDTLFLVIKKRPVSLLHYWHHASVLLYCWDAVMWETPSGIIFVAMNFSVHALMYYYYYLMACKRGRITWGHWVTKLQILQMVIGMASVGTHLYLRQVYKNCDGNTANLFFAGLIYFSYFVLFGQFYMRRYQPKEGGNKSMKEE